MSVVCVVEFSPPPLVFIGGSHPGNEAKPPWSTNYKAPHVISKLWDSWAVTTWSAGHVLRPFGPVLGLKAARWALMLCMWVMACLESVW